MLSHKLCQVIFPNLRVHFSQSYKNGKSSSAFSISLAEKKPVIVLNLPEFNVYQLNYFTQTQNTLDMFVQLSFFGFIVEKDIFQTSG
jgi:hypothetical protein